MKEHHKNIYWNLIWYFSEFEYPYDFLVPYEDESIYQEFLRISNQVKARNKLRPE